MHPNAPQPISRNSLLMVLWLFLGGLLLSPVALSENVWIQVDTEAKELRVMRGGTVIETYPDIAIGRFGVTRDKRHMDGKTQLGEFRINRINTKSPFLLFYGFDYPHLDQAERAVESGELPLETFVRIRDAHRQRTAPPQNTPLGGYLGIHGIGAGDPEVHANYNWTNGCIALTNAQILSLSRWVGLGTRVVIY